MTSIKDNIIWYNKDGRFYNCGFCSMPNCSSRNTTAKSNCLLDKHEVTVREIDNKVMKANELLDKALDFIVETQEQNDYICEQMCEEYVGDYCEKNCQNLNKECVKLFLQKVYNKA